MGWFDPDGNFYHEGVPSHGNFTMRITMGWVHRTNLENGVTTPTGQPHMSVHAPRAYKTFVATVGGGKG